MTEKRVEFKWYSVELKYPGPGKNFHGNEMTIGKDTYMYTMMKKEPFFGVYINGELQQRYLHSSAAVGAILDAKKSYLEKIEIEDGTRCPTCGH